MDKILIIAEKPSLAKTIIKAVGVKVNLRITTKIISM